ncbi:MAG TPA: class I SAM-dependent methyltransferase [Azonexus sp.]|nr:class I SAM-dependent methyltransferase [Azonexus sp.]
MTQGKIWSYYQTQAPETFAGSGFRLNYLARRLRTGERVLNVGIGGGLFEREARQRGVDIHTLDPDWASLHSHAPEGISRLVAGRLETLPFASNTFDAIVVSEVLEHLTPAVMRQALSEISRVLVPGGRIIGTVPCEENLLENTFACPHCGEVFHKVGHQQSFDAAGIVCALEEFFTAPRCWQRAFMAKPVAGWQERSIDLIRNALVLSGILTRDKQLVFSGRKGN